MINCEGDREFGDQIKTKTTDKHGTPTAATSTTAFPKMAPSIPARLQYQTYQQPANNPSAPHVLSYPYCLLDFL